MNMWQKIAALMFFGYEDALIKTFMYRSQLKYMQKDFDKSFEFPSNVHVRLHYYFLFFQTFIKI